ncbi:uncharacterized protein LOC136066917 isoform X2 [Quercus suber]|uniref:uncharacterized protein LOC136066917 isoform X2 n=1 Tax=Quercus suber TaxID=58331 RepID=UPI0032DED723
MMLLADTQPHLKKRYHGCLEKVREFVDSVADFDELISPNSLYLYFLGPELFTHILKPLETNKKKMATRFSKKKLVEMKEKKDKSVPEEGGFISKKRFLEKKAKDEVIEKPKMVLQPAVPLSLRPHFSSSSLEVLPSGGGLKRKSVADFWTDVDFAVGKAHEVIFFDEPLMSKPSNELMSSYIHRAMCLGNLYSFLGSTWIMGEVCLGLVKGEVHLFRERFFGGPSDKADR